MGKKAKKKKNYIEPKIYYVSMERFLVYYSKTFIKYSLSTDFFFFKFGFHIADT